MLPAHTSHKSQPLDVGIIKPLKAAMARIADRAATYDQSDGSLPPLHPPLRLLVSLWHLAQSITSSSWSPGAHPHERMRGFDYYGG